MTGITAACESMILLMRLGHTTFTTSNCFAVRPRWRHWHLGKMKREGSLRGEGEGEGVGERERERGSLPDFRLRVQHHQKILLLVFVYIA
jgi:hypothetical protein